MIRVPIFSDEMGHTGRPARFPYFSVWTCWNSCVYTNSWQYYWGHYTATFLSMFVLWLQISCFCLMSYCVTPNKFAFVTDWSSLSGKQSLPLMGIGLPDQNCCRWFLSILCCSYYTTAVYLKCFFCHSVEVTCNNSLSFKPDDLFFLPSGWWSQVERLLYKILFS